MEPTDGRGADVVFDVVGGDGTETIWTSIAHGGRYLPVGFNDDPQSGLTGRPLRKVSMGNFSVVGVMLAYIDVPIEFRRFGVNPFPPAVGPRGARRAARAGGGRAHPAGDRPAHRHGRGRGRARGPRAAAHQRSHRRRRRARAERPTWRTDRAS